MTAHGLCEHALAAGPQGATLISMDLPVALVGRMTRTLLLALLAGCTVSPRFDAPEIVRVKDTATKTTPKTPVADDRGKFLQLGGQEGEPLTGGQEGEPVIGGQEGEPVIGGQEGEPITGGRDDVPPSPPPPPSSPDLDTAMPTTDDDIDLDGSFNGETDPTVVPDTADTGDVD